METRFRTVRTQAGLAFLAAFVLGLISLVIVDLIVRRSHQQMIPEAGISPEPPPALIASPAPTIGGGDPPQPVRAPARALVAAKPVEAAAPTAAAPVAALTIATPQGVAPAGMVVAVDPETGELGMPSPEQLARLAERGVGPAAAGTRVVTRHPDGSLSIAVRGQMREYFVVRTDRNGNLVPGCSTDRDAMTREAADATPAPNASEEE